MRIVQGAVAGFLAAAAVDLHAFQTWKSLDEAHTYNWKLAIGRWIMGAATGAATGLA
jgi:hypothetical protein